MDPSGGMPKLLGEGRLFQPLNALPNLNDPSMLADDDEDAQMLDEVVQKELSADRTKVPSFRPLESIPSAYDQQYDQLAQHAKMDGNES